MSDETRAVVRYLGGETGHRSFFGGTHSRTRVAMLAIFIAAGIVLTPLVGWPGLAVGAVGCAVTLAVTARTHRGSVVERRRKSRRWHSRVHAGTHEFAPYSDEAWQKTREEVAEARRGTLRGRRQAVARARRRLLALRAHPDGADGMGWLQHARGEPGIAWHAPAGEDNYLSVTFSVTGQLRGIESTAVMTRAAEGWGHFLAGRAPHSSLVGNVQTVTRVLPADSSMQEFWVFNSLDDEAPADAVASYEEVLRLTGEDAMVQRHFVTVSWPLTPAFTDAASRFGDGRDGWRALMKNEIDATARGLADARLGHVEALTARQTAALILHQQNPHMPIDLTRHVDASQFGLPSHDEFSAHIVESIDPTFARPGEPADNAPAVTWWHRTAAIHGEHLAVAGRSPLWCLDLLIGRELTFVRTVAFHLHLVPAGQAKAAARADVVRDMAGVVADQQKGRLVSDDSTTRMSAAQRRAADLAAGSHHHGVSWVGYITISAMTRDGLAQASRQLEEACSTGLGIDYLDWQDSFQSAASGATWPIGRGLRANAASLATRFIGRLAGRSEKEAIS